MGVLLPPPVSFSSPPIISYKFLPLSAFSLSPQN